jgi:uncharacterized protein (DUF488 family)
MGKGIILTIGHSTRTLEDYIALLKMNKVTIVNDIRTIPRSRYNPQFNSDTLPDVLKTVSIKYIHSAGLGGLRHPHDGSPNTGWWNPSFRGFADYMQTDEFEQNISDLIKLADDERVVLMCAEVVPWRCHRALIADALLIRGLEVEHIISENSRYLHKLTAWAKVNGQEIIYPEIGSGQGEVRFKI